jgi:hypothetical protein
MAMFVCGRRHLAYERSYQMAESIDFAANYIDHNELKRLVSSSWYFGSISSPPLQGILQEEDMQNRQESTGSLCMILLLFGEDKELDAEAMDIRLLLPN